jgi:hypothetical protein
MESWMSLATDKTKGALNIIASIFATGYIWFVLMPVADSMGMGLLLILYFLPLMFFILVVGVMTLNKAKYTPAFQTLLFLVLSLSLICFLPAGWLEDALENARSWHRPQELIFICILVFLWAIESYYLLRWMFKKDN